MNVRVSSRLGFILLSAVLATVMSGCGKKDSPTTSKEPAPASVRVAAPAPETVVAELYRQQARNESPFFQTKSRALVDKYLETTLADLIWKDAVTSSGEAGALDFDPLYDAQDTDIKNFAVQPAHVDARQAHVAVTFDNFGERKQIVYSLVPAGESWKIADITFGDGRTLRGVLSAGQSQEGSVPSSSS